MPRPAFRFLGLCSAALSGLALVVALGGCRGEGVEDVVAIVEGTPITTAELSDAYARLVIQAGLPGDDPAARQEVLQSLIHRRLVIQEAWDAGIRASAAYREAEAALRRKVLVDRYTGRVLYDTLRVTEAELRHLFTRANTVYEARHLFARSRAEAEALRKRLLAGETFEALASEVFADSALANSGGYLGTFGHDEMDPAFELAAFATPVGAISEPVRTAQGYSVLRVESRAVRPLLTESEFAARRDELARYERRRQRTEARFRHSRAVRDALAPQFEEATLAELAALASGVAVDGTPQEVWLRRPLVHFTSEVHGAQTWTVGDAEAMASLASPDQRAAVQDAASLREFIEGLLVREELVARAEAGGLARDDAFRRALAAALDEWVFDEAQQRLRLQLAPPEDTLRAHFAARRDVYVTPERVRVREILVETRRAADALRAQLRAGADFADLARTHSLRPGAAAHGGALGPVDRAALGHLAEAVFDARPGAVVGPLEVAGRYALLLRGETVAPRPMTFAEAREQVARDLDLRYAQTHLQAHVRALRARYRVEVRDDAVRRVSLIS